LPLVISYWRRLWDAPQLATVDLATAGGAIFGEAVAEMADALRDYAHDWQDHLLNAANHQENGACRNKSWAIIQ
jgi:hypothetical protein